MQVSRAILGPARGEGGVVLLWAIARQKGTKPEYAVFLLSLEVSQPDKGVPDCWRFRSATAADPAREGSALGKAMFKNTFQSGFLSILYSIGSKPLQIWEREVRNGHIKRITDNDIQASYPHCHGTPRQPLYLCTRACSIRIRDCSVRTTKPTALACPRRVLHAGSTQRRSCRQSSSSPCQSRRDTLP